jgi:DNA-binding transcriptional LysR family regulator
LPKSSLIPKPVTDYDLRLLRIFRVVVECGGFSAAESELGITRSTISVHMSSLEKRMRLTLCVRGRSGFALTEAGQTVYHAVMNLNQSLNDFSYLISSLGKELSGELVILCADQLDALKQAKLARVIQLLHDTSPNLQLVLDGDTVHNIERALLRDKAHAGLFPYFQQVEGLQYKPVSSEPIYLCCSKQHPLFNEADQNISAKRLASMPAIHPGIDIDAAGRTQLKKLNLAARAYQFDTRKAMVLSGRYLGYLPQSYIKEELLKGTIRIILPETMSYQFELSLVCKRMPRENDKVKLLTEAFAKIF